MHRTRVWLAVSPLIGGGVLLGHELAYRLTRTPSGSLHGYLEHAPQVLLLLGLVGVVLGAVTSRRRVAPSWVFAVAALATFVVQEHVERVVHTGSLPMLLTSPAFLLGVLLQLPVAAATWVVARRLLAALNHVPVRRPPRIVRLTTVVPARAETPAFATLPRPRGRGPPLLLRP